MLRHIGMHPDKSESRLLQDTVFYRNAEDAG
jgi:hypothetical protein